MVHVHTYKEGDEEQDCGQKYMLDCCVLASSKVLKRVAGREDLQRVSEIV